uniref:glucuronosyltransferase n=1 Tax=Caenorhabditis tropicalis TaxID=1561998 RepID=A0A1I7TAQ6_9PELO
MPVVMIGKRDECIGVKLTKDVVIVEAGEETIEQQKGDTTNDGNLQAFWYASMDSTNARAMNNWFGEALQASCRHFHSRRDIFNQMKSKNFDAAILEPISMCGLGYVKALGIEKVILASSFMFFDAILPYIGEPLDFSSVPGAFGASGEQMTMAERYENWMVTKEIIASLEATYDEEMKAYRQYSGKTLPDWRELLPQASLFFVNSNPFLDFPRQVLQKTIPIGGISINLEWIRDQKLSTEWEEILTKRPHSMLISFGSMIKSSHMPEKWRNGLLETIRSMPDVTFIWKYESDDVSFANGVSNIHFSKWVPQTALLNDHRLTAFVSHGGLGSTMELAYSGKPSILIPIFADQIRNANMLARHRGVIHLRKKLLENAESVRKAFNDVLFDETYKRNASKLANVLANQPYSPKDNVIKYTEFLGL